MSLFPDPRRIVTGHSQDGKSIVVDDNTISCLPTSIKCNFAVLYETHEFPATLHEWEDPIRQRTTNLANQNGVVLRVVDFPPNTETVRITPAPLAAECSDRTLLLGFSSHRIFGLWHLASRRNHMVSVMLTSKQ